MLLHGEKYTFIFVAQAGINATYTEVRCISSRTLLLHFASAGYSRRRFFFLNYSHLFLNCSQSFAIKKARRPCDRRAINPKKPNENIFPLTLQIYIIYQCGASDFLTAAYRQTRYARRCGGLGVMRNYYSAGIIPACSLHFEHRSVSSINGAKQHEEAYSVVSIVTNSRPA